MFVTLVVDSCIVLRQLHAKTLKKGFVKQTPSERFCGRIEVRQERIKRDQARTGGAPVRGTIIQHFR